MTARNYDVQFVNNLINNLLVLVSVAQLGRITSLNGNKADVQPLAHNYKDDKKRALLLDVPIPRSILEPLEHAEKPVKVGDPCIVVFLDRSMENWSGGSGDFPLDSPRMHSLNDAVIVGVF